MKKCKELLIVFILLLTVFISCDKDNNEKEIPEKNSWTMCILETYVKVELEGETENDKELIEQIENEVKVNMALLGDNFTFTPTHEDSSSGELVRTFEETQKEITSEYLFETTNDNIRYLKIIDNGIVSNILQIDYKTMYFLKDFTQDYSQSNNRIVSVIAGAKFTIPR